MTEPKCELFYLPTTYITFKKYLQYFLKDYLKNLLPLRDLL